MICLLMFFGDFFNSSSFGNWEATRRLLSENTSHIYRVAHKKVLEKYYNVATFLSISNFGFSLIRLSIQPNSKLSLSDIIKIVSEGVSTFCHQGRVYCIYKILHFPETLMELTVEMRESG